MISASLLKRRQAGRTSTGWRFSGGPINVCYPYPACLNLGVASLSPTKPAVDGQLQLPTQSATWIMWRTNRTAFCRVRAHKRFRLRWYERGAGFQTLGGVKTRSGVCVGDRNEDADVGFEFNMYTFFCLTARRARWFRKPASA